MGSGVSDEDGGGESPAPGKGSVCDVAGATTGVGAGNCTPAGASPSALVAAAGGGFDNSGVIGGVGGFTAKAGSSFAVPPDNAGIQLAINKTKITRYNGVLGILRKDSAHQSGTLSAVGTEVHVGSNVRQFGD